MAFARTVLLGAAAALASGGMMVGSASAAPAEAPPGGSGGAPDRVSTTGDVKPSTVTKHVWRNAPSYHARFFGVRAGTLFAGNNYFYCQDTGRTHEYGQYKNNWWLYTDDDNGNTGVWVSAVYISGGDNYEPIAGVPRC